MKTGQHSLTEGPIWKAILLFAMPILLGNIFQQFYNTFDSWCVGNYIGENALPLQLGLELQPQGQIFLPPGMLQTPGIGAHHQHDLGGGLPRHRHHRTELIV